MVPLGGPSGTGSPDSALADGNVMGKRYVDENGAEVLVTKAASALSQSARPHWSSNTPHPCLPATERSGRWIAGLTHA